MDFTVQVTYLEIYNERIFDLLQELEAGPHGVEGGEYAIADDPSGLRGTVVKGLTQVPVATEEEALNQLFRGEIARTTAEHLLNKQSNRSHCVFTVHVEQRSRLGGGEKTLFSKLHLVDLAGSERLKKTMAGEEGPAGHGALDPTTKRESMYINRSLTFLEQCVVALTSPARQHGG